MPQKSPADISRKVVELDKRTGFLEENDKKQDLQIVELQKQASEAAPLRDTVAAFNREVDGLRKQHETHQKNMQAGFEAVNKKVDEGNNAINKKLDDSVSEIKSNVETLTKERTAHKTIIEFLRAVGSTMLAAALFAEAMKTISNHL